MKLNIVIVGMGEVGKHIARVLEEEGHGLVLIDKSEASLAVAEEQYDARVLCGHGASPRVLQQAEVHKADLFIAVTDNDEINLLSSLQAKRMGARKVIARVSNQVYFDDHRPIHKNMFESIDVVINPEVLVAVEIHKLVRHSGAVAIEDFANDRIEMVELQVASRCAALHKPLRELDLPANTLIAAIDRDGELIIPSGDDVIRPGDLVMAIGRVEQIPALERHFSQARTRKTPKVFIVGGSELGEHLAWSLSREGVEIFFIEESRARCEELAERLGEGVTVLHGAGTDQHLLEEYGVGTADVFIACSKADELNLMASLLARDMNARRVVTLLHKPDYAVVCARLGIDITLSPRLAAAQQVLTHVRAGQILGVRPMLDGRGEFLEFVAPPQARVVGRPIKDIGFPRGASICAVMSNKGAFVPRGNDVIEPGDRVIVFSTANMREQVEGFFKRSDGGWFST